MNAYPTKWRPTLWMVVIGMLVFIMSLPLGGIWIFRFYDDHLVRETENELIVQGAFVEAMFVAELKRRSFDPARLSRATKIRKQSRYNPIDPQLDLSASNILEPRPDAILVEATALPELLSVGESILPAVWEAQRTTLAGFRILDPNGIVIAGRSDTGLSLDHVLEVKQALSGNYASVIRKRISDNPTPPIYSISRGTGIRVFVAMPINYEGKLAGVAYLSRTPSHFFRELYDQRWKLIAAGLFILTITLFIGFVFVRTIKGPIDALNARTQRISEGDSTAFVPLKRHGTSEIAELSEGLLSMAKKLKDRSDYIQTFASHVSHELKSPLTSIKGAAELLKDADENMEPKTREKFLANIIGDTDRLTRLLDRLRDHAKAESLVLDGYCSLADVRKFLEAKFPNLEFNCNAEQVDRLSIPLETANMVFANLAENAAQHHAKTLTISVAGDETGQVVSVVDDGNGISKANQEKVFDLFFTTRREHGGTGMGLGIVRALLNSHGASIELTASRSGTRFDIYIPSQ